MKVSDQLRLAIVLLCFVIVAVSFVSPGVVSRLSMSIVAVAVLWLMVQIIDTVKKSGG